MIDDDCWRLMMDDDCWWLMMMMDDDCWRLMMVDHIDSTGFLHPCGGLWRPSISWRVSATSQKWFGRFPNTLCNAAKHAWPEVHIHPSIHAVLFLLGCLQQILWVSRNWPSLQHSHNVQACFFLNYIIQNKNNSSEHHPKTYNWTNLIDWTTYQGM